MILFGGAAAAGGRKTLKTFLGAAAALAVTVAAVAPAQAAGSLGSAEKLRRLDIMLMVTSLRCRSTADNFNVEYGRFTSSHMSELNQASDQLRADLVGRFGAGGSARALDRISTVMANAYGQGHPWLSCGELKKVASDLAMVRGRDTLVEAADQLLGEARAPELAYARR
jgi:hypothetical protein